METPGAPQRDYDRDPLTVEEAQDNLFNTCVELCAKACSDPGAYGDHLDAALRVLEGAQADLAAKGELLEQPY